MTSPSPKEIRMSGDIANLIHRLNVSVPAVDPSKAQHLGYEAADVLKEQAAELDTLRKRVVELEAGWQPIETAPKDGGKFLAHLTNGWIVFLWGNDGIRNGYRYQWWTGQGASIPYEPSHPADTDWAKTNTLRATHWRPLPAPPSLPNKEDGNGHHS